MLKLKSLYLLSFKIVELVYTFYSSIVSENSFKCILFSSVDLVYYKLD